MSLKMSRCWKESSSVLLFRMKGTRMLKRLKLRSTIRVTDEIINTAGCPFLCPIFFIRTFWAKMSFFCSKGQTEVLCPLSELNSSRIVVHILYILGDVSWLVGSVTQRNPDPLGMLFLVPPKLVLNTTSVLDKACVYVYVEQRCSRAIPSVVGGRTN